MFFWRYKTLNKKEAETLLILTNFLHDLWQGFKAMVLVGSCIVVIRLALQMLGTMATGWNFCGAAGFVRAVVGGTFP